MTPAEAWARVRAVRAWLRALRPHISAEEVIITAVIGTITGIVGALALGNLTGLGTTTAFLIGFVPGAAWAAWYCS